VQRYLSLPWTMRRKGAKLGAGTDQYNQNVTCFASPYVEGGTVDTAPCPLDNSVYYPTSPPPGNKTIPVPDLSRQKMERCAAMKRAILRPAASRYNLPNASILPVIPNSNISCGPEQLCYYPKPLPTGMGGWPEAVNTELGVEVSV